jgi:peptide-methionine (S)-S-oxide reductase
MNTLKIGFGGGCHWCTEAVFQSLRGVTDVEQGFIKSFAPHDSYSEAALITFDANIIPLAVLIDVHLRTHASTSPHKMRGKYRSAIYVFSQEMTAETNTVLAELQSDFEDMIVTMTLPFDGFKPSLEQFQDYYKTNTERPFCKTYIDPKLAKIRRQFGNYYMSASSFSSK